MHLGAAGKWGEWGNEGGAEGPGSGGCRPVFEHVLRAQGVKQFLQRFEDWL